MLRYGFTDLARGTGSYTNYHLIPRSRRNSHRNPRFEVYLAISTRGFHCNVPGVSCLNVCLMIFGEFSVTYPQQNIFVGIWQNTSVLFAFTVLHTDVRLSNQSTIFLPQVWSFVTVWVAYKKPRVNKKCLILDVNQNYLVVGSKIGAQSNSVESIWRDLKTKKANGRSREILGSSLFFSLEKNDL